jgi:hypothetical protein
LRSASRARRAFTAARIARVELAAHPALAPAPVEQLRVRRGDRRGGLRHGQAPQRRAGAEERQAVLAQVAPEAPRLHRLAAQLARARFTALSAPERRTRSTPSSHAAPESGSGWPAQRFACSMAAASPSANASVASSGGARQHLERELGDRAQRAQRSPP